MTTPNLLDGYISRDDAARGAGCSWRTLRRYENLPDRKRKTEWERNRRHEQGVCDREQWLASRLSRLKPWEPLGITRRTWERRRKAAREAQSARVASLRMGSIRSV